MLLTPHRSSTPWHTLLVLGRVSNLPTVWSNCLAGWLLGGGGSMGQFLVLALGATCLYVGGMFLNDAFDVEFDRLHRRERPIPSGRISLDAVWRWGFGWLGLGTVLLVLLGNGTGAFAALLLFSILFYDAVHKLVASAPLLMGLCRFFLYLTAAAAGRWGVTGLAIWSGLALAAYVAGLSYLARHERSRRGLPRWPILLLCVPLAMALVSNAGVYRLVGVLLTFLVGLWLLVCLQPAFLARDMNVGRAVSGLLAGIVLIDLLALAGTVGLAAGCALVLMFLLALFLQRTIPAT